jgi:hypothetical protein
VILLAFAQGTESGFCRKILYIVDAILQIVGRLQLIHFQMIFGAFQLR